MRSLWHEIRCGNRVVDTFPSKREAAATIHILDAIHPDRKYRVRRAHCAPQFAHNPSPLQGSEQVSATCLSASPPAPRSSLLVQQQEWFSPRMEEQTHEQSSIGQNTRTRKHTADHGVVG